MQLRVCVIAALQHFSHKRRCITTGGPMASYGPCQVARPSYKIAVLRMTNRRPCVVEWPAARCLQQLPSCHHTTSRMPHASHASHTAAGAVHRPTNKPDFAKRFPPEYAVQRGPGLVNRITFLWTLSHILMMPPRPGDDTRKSCHSCHSCRRR
jgi:hypothetical protein